VDGKSVIAMTAVTGADPNRYFGDFAQQLPGVTFNEEDGTVTTSTFLMTEKGVFVVKTTLEAEGLDLDRVQTKILRASPDSRKFVTAKLTSDLQGLQNRRDLSGNADLDEQIADLQQRIADLALLANSKVEAKQQPQLNADGTPVGGIDFNSKNLNLQIKRDGNGVPLPMNLQPINTIDAQFKGFMFNIIEIVPANLPLILGMEKSPQPTVTAQLSSAK
jgi:hypothetical protein